MPERVITNETVSDTELVHHLKAHNPDSMEILLSLHGAKIYGIAYQFTRNETTAQDVVQDTLIAIWNKIDSFQGRSSFTSWMYRVAANAALMRLRKEKHFSDYVSLDKEDINHAKRPLQLEGHDPLPDGVIQSEELKERIQRAINQLPEPYRTVVLLKDVEEFSLEEIAGMTDTSLAAIKSRLHRARLTLREILVPYLKAQEATKI